MSVTMINITIGDIKVFQSSISTFENLEDGIFFTDDSILKSGTYLSSTYPPNSASASTSFDLTFNGAPSRFGYASKTFIHQIVPPYAHYIVGSSRFYDENGGNISINTDSAPLGYNLNVTPTATADDIAETSYPLILIENYNRTQLAIAEYVTWGERINEFYIRNAVTYEQLESSWGSYFTNNVNQDATDDPYDPSGTSGTGGGTGDLDGTSDSIDIPSLPTLTAVDSGFVSLFNPTLSQLKSLASYMWGSLFDLDNFKKLFNDPMECILGLSIVPVNVPSGGAETITVGNLITAVTMNKATTQYVSVDCGSLNVNEYWGAYLDYAPHTKAQIYLPYCGTHDIDVDDIMNKTVHVVYHIDILTGGCVAYVKCGSSVLYEFSGNCATQIPVTNNDFSNMMKSIIDVGVAVGGALATGGMTAPLTMASAVESGAESLAGSSINGGMKPNVQKSGSMSSSIGLMGVQTPYIILTRPRQCVPGKQNEYTGYPSYITETLGSLSGYTEIHSIHLDGIPATDEELNEIESLLSKGVIL